MANFNTSTKVIINDVSVKDDSVAGSLAKEIELLINESVISSYKAQQYFARKQKHAQKQ